MVLSHVRPHMHTHSNAAVRGGFVVPAAFIVPLVLVAAVGALLLSSYLRAQTSADSTGLILSLSFDDATNVGRDASSYGHHGTVVGATGVSGKVGNALWFDGVDDYVRVPHAAALSPTSAITVEAWVYPDTAKKDGRIVQKRNISEGGGYVLNTIFSTPLGNKFELYHADIAESIATGISPATLWQHVAGTFDGSVVKIYQDGVLKGSKSYSGNMTAASTDLIIGGVQQTFNMPFHGKIDEVKVYNRALTAEEIACEVEGKAWVSGSCGAAAAVAADTTPPGTPTEFSLVDQDGTSAVVRWTHPSDNVGLDSCQFRWKAGQITPMTEADWAAAPYDLPHYCNAPAGSEGRTRKLGFTPGVDYALGLKACDAAGNCSGIASLLFRTSGSTTTVPTPTATPSPTTPIAPAPAPDTLPPDAPTSLTIVGVGGRNVDISWVVPTDNVGVTRFAICYRTGTSVTAADCSGGTTIFVTTIPPPGMRTTYRYDTLWLPDTEYAFGIRACDAAGNCSPLTTTTFRTQKAPTAPGSPTVSAITATSATIAWLPSTSNVELSVYEIRYRIGSVFTATDWDGAGGTAAAVVAFVPLERQISELMANTQYTVAIKAYDTAGNESPIAAVTFRTILSGGVSSSPPATATTTTTPLTTATTSTTTTTTPLTTATTSTTTTTTTSVSGTTTSTAGGGGGGGAATTTTTPLTTATSATTTTTTPRITATLSTTTIIPTTATATAATEPLRTATGSTAPRPVTQTAEERATHLKTILQEAAEVFVRTLAELSDLVGVTEGSALAVQHQQLVEKVVSDAVDTVTKERITNFVAVGTQTTLKLGAGERAGVVNSFREAFGREPEQAEDWEDVVKIANGRFPSNRNLEREDDIRATFVRIYRREPNLGNPNDAAAIMTMAYGMRPEPRNVIAEQSGIRLFKRIFGRAPTTASDWDAVRAIAYSGAKR